MAHADIAKEVTRTQYEGNPTVRIISVPDGPVNVQVTLQIESVPEGREAKFSRITFRSVFEYRWIKSEQTYFLTDKDDYESALIEILGSSYIEVLVSSGMYSNRSPGSRLGGFLDERHLHHYRLGFNEYGSFDVIALGVDVDTYSGVRDWPAS